MTEATLAHWCADTMTNVSWRFSENLCTPALPIQTVRNGAFRALNPGPASQTET